MPAWNRREDSNLREPCSVREGSLSKFEVRRYMVLTEGLEPSTFSLRKNWSAILNYVSKWLRGKESNLELKFMRLQWYLFNTPRLLVLPADSATASQDWRSCILTFRRQEQVRRGKSLQVWWKVPVPTVRSQSARLRTFSVPMPQTGSTDKGIVHKGIEPYDMK